MKRLQQLCRPPPDLGLRSAPPARGFRPAQWPATVAAQREQRCVVRWCSWPSGPPSWVGPSAKPPSICISVARTLRQWQLRSPQDLPAGSTALGRPLLRSSRHERNDVIALLHELGPATGVPTLQPASPPCRAPNSPTWCVAIAASGAPAHATSAHAALDHVPAPSGPWTSPRPRSPRRRLGSPTSSPCATWPAASNSSGCPPGAHRRRRLVRACAPLRLARRAPGPENG